MFEVSKGLAGLIFTVAILPLIGNFFPLIDNPLAQPVLILRWSQHYDGGSNENPYYNQKHNALL